MIVIVPAVKFVRATPNTIVVPDDYSTIQAAINAASDGDTLFVKKGTYELPVNQTLVIDKTLSLMGEDAENTIINLHPAYNMTWILTAPFFNYSDAITVTADGVKLSGFTFNMTSPGGYISVTGDGTEIVGNRIETGPTTGLSVNGSHCNITENISGGKIYFKGSFNTVAWNSFYGIALESGDSNTIRDNTYSYLLLGYSNQTCWYNVISGNHVETKTRNYSGISLSNGSHNIFYNNYVSGFGYGLTFYDMLTVNNTFCCNSFVGSLFAYVAVYPENLTRTVNFWDNGKEGNYWDDYNGTDSNMDGIGDTPYVIDSNNIDNHPLMAPFTSFDVGTWEWTSYTVDVVSNSTVSDFSFNPEGALMQFKVAVETGTTGFCIAAIPKNLLYTEGNWNVLVDGYPVTPTVNEDADNTYLYFTYSHSTKTVEIIGTTAIPEFPSWIILPLFLTVTLVVTVYRKKLSRKSIQHSY